MSDAALVPDGGVPPLAQPSPLKHAPAATDMAAADHAAATASETPPQAAGTAGAGESAAAEPSAGQPAAATPLAAAEPGAEPGAEPTAAPQSALKRGRLVQEGDTVILEVNRDRHSFVHVKRGGCAISAWSCSCILRCLLCTAMHRRPRLPIDARSI